MKWKMACYYLWTALILALVFFPAGCGGNGGLDGSSGSADLTAARDTVTDLVSSKGTVTSLDPSVYTVAFALGSDWGSGFGGTISIRNNGTIRISSWTLEFDFDRKLTGIWNAKIVSSTQNHYIITGDSWNSYIEPGGTVSFGFNGSPGNVKVLPSTYTLKAEAPSGSGTTTSGSTSVTYTTTSDWGSGFNGELKVKNTGTAAITGWSMEFDFDKSISGMWNAKISSHQGSHYMVNPESYTTTIAAGVEISIGFSGTPGNVTQGPSNVNVSFQGGGTPTPTPTTSVTPTPTPTPTSSPTPTPTPTSSPTPTPTPTSSPTPTPTSSPTPTPTPTASPSPSPTLTPSPSPSPSASPGAATVPGWPAYIAMGAVTDSDYTNAGTFANRPVDSIFKYSGDGGNGDPGKITFPIYTINTMKQAQLLTASFSRKVMPVMVVYTAEMSGGTSFKDFDDLNLCLTMHFINLMLDAGTMQSYQRSDNANPGSIILNPDLLGMVQQQGLWRSEGSGALNTSFIDVTAATRKAYWFMTTRHTWNIQRSWGNPITVTGATPLEFIAMVNNGDLKSLGVYSPWDIKAGWESAAVTLLTSAPSTINAGIPSFSNNFTGWISATNWAIKTFGPGITFGWQSNVWSTGSANWVHNSLTDAQIKSSYATPVSTLWNQLGVYNGTYRPDFVVFDKYEMDATAAAAIGYLWNQRDLGNYMTFVKQISDSLGNKPVMLWQIPGGHLQKTSNDVDTRGSHGSTEPDYFFGDADLQPNLSNVQPYILNLSLPGGSYNFQGSAKEYLTQNNQSWTAGHMAKARDCRIFSILWGGGQTTSVGTVGANDNGWLSGKLIEYYRSPTNL
ncbi:MAG: cellulose binding domain-containing protein [Vulcanimicrobiota bacterium]